MLTEVYPEVLRDALDAAASRVMIGRCPVCGMRGAAEPWDGQPAVALARGGLVCGRCAATIPDACEQAARTLSVVRRRVALLARQRVDAWVFWTPNRDGTVGRLWPESVPELSVAPANPPYLRLVPAVDLDDEQPGLYWPGT